MLGDHAVVSDGFSKIIDGLATFSEVLLEREVVRIEYNDAGVRVHTRGGGEGVQADAVLMTVPLGVLKKKSIKWVPSLPAWKREAIDRLGFGPVEKVVLLFQSSFWDAGVDFFGCLMPPDAPVEAHAARRGEFFLFWNLHRSHSIFALSCISSGEFAETRWRTLSYKTIVAAALAALCRTFGEQVYALFRRPIVSDWVCWRRPIEHTVLALSPSPCHSMRL